MKSTKENSEDQTDVPIPPPMSTDLLPVEYSDGPPPPPLPEVKKIKKIEEEEILISLIDEFIKNKKKHTSETPIAKNIKKHDDDFNEDMFTTMKNDLIKKYKEKEKENNNNEDSSIDMFKTMCQSLIVDLKNENKNDNMVDMFKTMVDNVFVKVETFDKKEIKKKDKNVINDSALDMFKTIINSNIYNFKGK